MNRLIKGIVIFILFLLSNIVHSQAFLDSKTNPLKDLGLPDFVALAEMESQIADSVEATLYIKKNE